MSQKRKPIIIDSLYEEMLRSKERAKRSVYTVRPLFNEDTYDDNDVDQSTNSRFKSFILALKTSLIS